MRNSHRIFALALAVLMICTVLFSLFSAVEAYAAGKISIDSSSINITGNLTSRGYLIKGNTYEISFTYTDSSITSLSSSEVGTMNNLDYSFTGTSAFNKASSNTSVELEIIDPSSPYILVTIKNAVYNGSSNATMYLNITKADFPNGNTYVNDTDSYKAFTLTMPIPDEYLSGSGGGTSGGNSGGSDSDVSYSSDIVVENVILRDKEGNQINGTITKDSPPFDMDVVFSDLGLEEADQDEFKTSNMQGFLTSAGGFIPGATNRGAVTLLTSSYDYPRFRVRFTDLTYDGGSNSITFRIQYSIDDQSVSGTGTAYAYQAKTEDEEDEDETAPPTPYIIISQYSYGGGQIEAGQDFGLDITYRNTSSDLPLENIVMTVTPDADNLTIASASNTFYIESLAAGASQSATIQLQTKPAALVGSHEVSIAFTYEYIHDKERKNGEKTEKIAIPVTQIDRFAVDPITEMSDVVGQGEEAYVTVSFINRGKSTTYNISGIATANLEIIAPSQHYGNLEAGKSDSIDITFIPQEWGDLYGDVVIQYEDENTNQNEITIPFNIYVEQPYSPPDWEGETPGWEDPGEVDAGFPVFTVVLCVIGGLLVAGPIALYLMKRVKAKGIEDFDEDF